MDSEIPYGGMTEWKLQKGFGNEKKEIKVIRLRPEKDDSDTQSAMNYAIRTGAKKIVIFGVTGNRVDHLMANFGLLVLAQNQGAEVTLVDQYNYMKLISDGTVLKKSEQFGKYVSFFPLGGDVTGLTLEGFKYSNYSKIELIRKGNSAKSVCDSKKLLGIVTDFKKEELKEQKILETEKWEKQIKIFDLNQAGSLAEWIYQLWEEIQKR